MDNIIILILFAAGLSLLFNILFKRINIDVIIGYILAGTVLGFIFNLQGAKSGTLEVIAEFGIAFLMFTIGIEFSVEKLKSIKKEVFVYGAAQFFITSVVFYAIARYGFEVRAISAFVIGTALSLSSTVIVLKLLNEQKLLYKVYGKNSLGVLLFQDLIVIPILLIISILATINANFFEVIQDVLINTAGLMLIFVLGERFLVRRFLDYVMSAKSDEIFIMAILFLVIGSSQLSHAFGFTYSLGAFVAGLIIAKTQYKHQIEADLIPFRDLLLGIFFLTVGMQLDLAFIPQNITAILVVLMSVMLIKAFLVFIIMNVGYRRQTSLKTAIMLSQVGEFSFVIFEVAHINGIFIDEILSQTILASIIFSMILTPLIFHHVQPITNLFLRKQDDKSDETSIEHLSLEDHVIICGYGALGKLVSGGLNRIKMSHIILERDHVLVQDGQNRGDNMILGNAAKKKILDWVNIDSAKAVVIAIPQEEKMMRIVEVIREMAPHIQIIAKASSLYQRDFFASMGKVSVIDELCDTSESMIEVLRRERK